MQQAPVKQTGNMPNAPKVSQDDASPALLLARKIRKEQGAEQLKAYLSAIEPFIAPNELKSICAAFGLNFSALPKNQVRQTAFRSGNISGGASRNTAGINTGAGNRNMRTGSASIGESRSAGNQKRNGNINQRNKNGNNQNFGNTGNTGNANMNDGANRTGYGVNGGARMNNSMNNSMNTGMNNSMGANAGAGMNTGTGMGTGMKGNPIQMMQQLMQMQNLMNSGGDIQKLLNFLGKS